MFANLKNKYVFHQEFHGYSILKNDFHEQYTELNKLLESFTITEKEILTPGGGKSPIALKFDKTLYDSGWQEKQFMVELGIDGETQLCPTHNIDYYKNRIGIELEWNNKDPFYDRDLNNFRLLHSIKALSVGVIVTRTSELQSVFNRLGKGASYGASTTHWGKLIPKVVGGGAGTCPLILIGITKDCIL